MLNQPSTLYYKSSICIEGNELTGESLAEVVLQIIYDALKPQLSIDIPFYSFMSHGHFYNEDQSEKVQIASHDSKIWYWAARVKIADRQNKRRYWISHLCIQHDKNTRQMNFSLAVFYQDYSALCFSSIPKPNYQVPDIILSLLKHNNIECIDGGYQVPYFDIALNKESMPACVDLLFSESRTMPVFFLVGIEEYINELETAEVLAGNGFVFYVENISVVDALNTYLPIDSKLSYGGIHIYLPVKQGVLSTRTIDADRIINFGDASILSGICNGFCSALRNDDRRKYYTFEDILSLRQREKHIKLEADYSALTNANDQATSHRDRLQRQVDELIKRCDEAEAMLERDLWAELEKEEKKTAQAVEFAQSIQEQINGITDMLFAGESGHSVLEDIPSCSELAHLREALKYRLPERRSIMKYAQ